MADNVVDALPLPPAAQQSGGTDVMRAVIIENRLEVSLRRAFKEPELWGMLIADVACHAARTFATETEMSEYQALAAIQSMFDAELDEPNDPGATHAVS